MADLLLGVRSGKNDLKYYYVVYCDFDDKTLDFPILIPLYTLPRYYEIKTDSGYIWQDTISVDVHTHQWFCDLVTIHEIFFT